MAWYWPELDSPQSAKTAAVNAVGVSALFALWIFLTALSALALKHPPRTGRLWASLAIAVALAVIGWGIRRMSRTAAIAGVVWWFGWFGLGAPGMITAAYRSGSPFAFLWPVLIFVFLLFYIIAVRATFAYRHLTATSTVAAPQVSQK